MMYDVQPWNLPGSSAVSGNVEWIGGFYGQCVEQVSVYDNIVTSAYTIAVPACLE